jgi:hypothetical protein
MSYRGLRDETDQNPAVLIMLPGEARLTLVVGCGVTDAPHRAHAEGITVLTTRFDPKYEVEPIRSRDGIAMEPPEATIPVRVTIILDRHNVHAFNTSP